MTRRIIVAILRFAMRVYFRRVEVVGIENVPRRSPVIFVLNHPNALVDPAFLLSLAPRRVSFLAKSPLFRMPMLGYLVRAMDSLPVYRHQDEGEDVSKNREMVGAARNLLARGGTIGICPEGVSHDEPRLRPIKTGAARIALAAVSNGLVTGAPGEQPASAPHLDLKIVPAGLYYTSKTKFRSAVMLYAEHEEALQTITRAERIFSSEADNEGSESLAEELQLQQRFVKAYRVLRERAPERLTKLEVRMSRFEEELSQAGVDPDDLSPPTSTLDVFSHLITRVLVFLLLLIPATLGALLHYPAYRLGGYLATRFSKNDDDVVSTVKIMSAMLLFPMTWLAVAVVGYKLEGWTLALMGAVGIPLAGYLAIRFFEEFDKFMGGLRALAFFLVRRRFFVRLLAERKAIRSEILALGDETANFSH